MPYQTLRTQCVKDRKKSEKTFVWLIEVWFLYPWVTVRQRKPDFFLEECDPMCSKVLSSNCVCWSSCIFFLFYTENCKTCSTFITPWIQDSDSDPTSNSIFLTWLVQSLGSRLGISITNISSEKRKLFWKVLESHSFCFISNYRSEQEQSFLFSYFHLILRLVNRQDYCALHLQDFVPFRARS